jgi:GGDEF domain-containing protein
VTGTQDAPAGGVFYAGDDPRTAASLAHLLGRDVQRGLPPAVGERDLVVLETWRSSPALVGGNAFAACRAFKERNRARVLLLVRHDDPYGADVARACQADAALVVGEDGALAPGQHFDAAPRRRPQLDALLARLERELAAPSDKHASAIQKMVAPDQHDWVLRQFTDAETGLLRSDFAAFRLEDEFKRALRLRQSLAVVLLDVGGEGALPVEADARARALAEIGSVLLNESRDIDVLGRFTASTFLLLLPGTTFDGAAALTRRVLADLARRDFGRGAALVPRAGIAMAPRPGITRRDQLLLRAEACLRAAQAGGGEGGLCVAEA